MDIRKILVGAAGCCLLASMAQAADYQVQRSVKVDLPSTEVWHRIGDFCDIDDFHPDIRFCTLKVIDGRLHRVLTTAEGGEIVERRIAEEAGLSITYKMVSTPMPFEGYTATLAVNASGGTEVIWSVRFSSEEPGAEAQMTAFVERGMASIAGLLGAQ